MKWNRVITLMISLAIVKVVFQTTWTELFWLLLGLSIGLAVWYCIADAWNYLTRQFRSGPEVHYHFHDEHYEEHRHVELHKDFTRPYSARVPKPKELKKGSE